MIICYHWQLKMYSVWSKPPTVNIAKVKEIKILNRPLMTPILESAIMREVMMTMISKGLENMFLSISNISINSAHRIDRRVLSYSLTIVIPRWDTPQRWVSTQNWIRGREVLVKVWCNVQIIWGRKGRSCWFSAGHREVMLQVYITDQKPMSGNNLKTNYRRQGIGRHQLFELIDADYNVRNTEVVKLEKFYTNLYKVHSRQENYLRKVLEIEHWTPQVKRKNLQFRSMKMMTHFL